MTTPENAEHKIHTELDSDLENVELNEPNNNNNNNYNNNDQNSNNNNNFNHNNEFNNKTNKRHSYTSATPTPPPSTNNSNTYSSNSSLSSDSSCPPQPERSQSVPPHYPYAYGYPYPWYMPPPPPPTAQTNGEVPAAAPLPHMINWPYPYPYPPPPPPDGKVPDGYPAYPYYYPYYPPPPYGQPAPPTSEGQQPNQYPSFIPPYGAYPYAVAPSYSQSSQESRASSVLPDIIITPSTDDMPSQLVMQHHIKVEPREPPKRAHSVEIEEVSSRPKTRNICSNKHEVIDVLSQRLANINKISSFNTQANLSNQLQKNYAGEQSKELGARSPSENASPVLLSSVTLDDSDTEDSSDEDEITPKHASRPAPLQAIKSVTNVQVYKGLGKAMDEQLQSESDDDDEDDVTTADGESEIFDEELQVEEEEEEGLVEELDEDCMDDLSVIYEEESELERSSDYAKTVIKRDGSNISDATLAERQMDELDKQIEDDDKGDKDDEDDDEEESNSVTVRLPLRFSFSRSSNDENIATVEVGNTTQIEQRRNSIELETKRSSFSVAKLENDSEGEDDDNDCEVSVTISLSSSSRSNSVEKQAEAYKVSTAYPVEDMCAPLKESSEDVDSTFSLGMRNKFLGETIAGEVTNNIAQEVSKTNVEAAAAPKEEFDFFATLMATKMQAQKMMEESKNLWKTPVAKTLEETNDQNTTEAPKMRAKDSDNQTKAPRPKSSDMSKTQASLEAAKNSFWSTFATAAQEPMTEVEPAQEEEEIDFWASIEKSKEETHNGKKKKKVTYTALQRESIAKVEFWTSTLYARRESLPVAQRAETDFIEEESKELESKTEEHEMVVEEEDFWASVEKAKTNKSTDKVYSSNSNSNYWTHQEAEHPESEETIENGITSDGENHEDVDFWADIKETSSSDHKNEVNAYVYDPTKYPEEPREVDTDEEIDFWAEIEAKRKDDDDDVTFHKSATFWARKDRQNSVEETPFKPVETKAFRAKLPDEPAVEIDIWSTLESARGDEPELVDPVVEEEKVLAEQYNELEHEDEVEKTQAAYTNEEAEPKNQTVDSNLSRIDTMSLASMASMHEPATVYTWAHYTQPNEQAHNDEDPNFWANIEEDPEQQVQAEEAEQKRHNYRKAMAFFSTSIDEHKDNQGTERYRPSEQTSNRNSAILEDMEAPQWTMETAHIELDQPGEFAIIGENGDITEEHKPEPVELEEERADLTPTNHERQLPEVYIETQPQQNLLTNGLDEQEIEKFSEVYVEPQPPQMRLANGLPDLGIEQFSELPKISVRDRITVFEASPDSNITNAKTPTKAKSFAAHSLSVESCNGKGTLSRNSSSQRSESEMEEDDSGVTDMNKLLSETDTESESFPELRKMTSYQRAATHSRLFKLLQDVNDVPDGEASNTAQTDEFQFKPSRRKIVHNVSITRRQNPNALAEAETLSQRRERLSLPLRKNTSIDADNPSTPNSPASPIMGQPNNQNVVSDKLVNELVQSLLLKNDSTHLRNMPMERLQAAAKRALAEEMDSMENTSVDSTPAITPKQDKEYADYYNSWSDAAGSDEVVPSKAFRALQDPRRSPWTVRCPRVLSSKTINRDLARVTESPEILNSRGSKSPECFRQSRERSVSSWRKV